MAVLSQKNETIVLVAVAAVAYLIYKKMKVPIAEAYNTAVDTTADVIADAIGLDDKAEELAEPTRDTPGHAALRLAHAAWLVGERVDEATWKMALDWNPINSDMLRAGKAWGYGHWWNYWGKSF